MAHEIYWYEILVPVTWTERTWVVCHRSYTQQNQPIYWVWCRRDHCWIFHQT